MERKTKTLMVLMLLLPALVAGCSRTRKTLGFGRNAPDEFSVVSQRPLTLPPDFNLRPPSSTHQADPLLPETLRKAEKVVLGQQPVSEPDKTLSTGESTLLEKVGAASADPDIRTVLDWEAPGSIIHDQSLTDRVLNAETVVNAPVEAERLKQNRKDGKAVTEGDTPMVKKKRGWFGKIFK